MALKHTCLILKHVISDTGSKKNPQPVRLRKEEPTKQTPRACLVILFHYYYSLCALYKHHQFLLILNNIKFEQNRRATSIKLNYDGI